MLCALFFYVLFVGDFIRINVRLSYCGGYYEARVRNFSVFSIRFSCVFVFPLVLNIVQLSRRPGTQRFVIEMAVFIEETIDENIHVTK